jgi:hypothetical protein
MSSEVTLGDTQLVLSYRCPSYGERIELKAMMMKSAQMALIDMMDLHNRCGVASCTVKVAKD